VFAVDSIPAILAVTRDPFLVFTSNAFAILGLRALYFAVAGLMAMFRYLKYSLVLILAFVGVKMLLVNHYHVPNLMSLGIIVATLGAGVLASLWATRREGETERS
jgi:tellurite resistance protein TerC